MQKILTTNSSDLLGRCLCIRFVVW
ncbi:hypothetical protein WI665_11665 [Vibrio cholerae]